MNTLSQVNSYRIVAILEDTLEKLGFLSSITPDVLAHREELSEFVGDEISRVIEEQRRLESRYEELIAMRGSLKGLANKSKYKQNQNDIQEVSRALRESTKNLCRNLKDNPNVTGNLLKIQDERNNLENLIHKTVNEIRENKTFSILENYVRETEQEQERLNQVIEKEKETATAVQELEEELAEEKKEHEKEDSERKALIAQLKEELQTIRSTLAFKIEYSRKEALAKIKSTSRTYEYSENELSKKIESLKRKKMMEEEVHQSTMEFYTQRQETMLEQAAEWSDRYIADMDELETQLNELTEIREKDRERLNQLQERWDRQVAEEEAKIEEERRQKELEELRIKEEEDMKKAAITIQRKFKQHLLANPPAPAKGGKGKKGKKGKKK